MTRCRVLVLSALLIAACARTALATPAESAQAAFDEGRRLEDAGDFAAAAARFEESERLDPALGTLLNLANCYERAGKLASAWRAFQQGSEEAAARGETKRAQRAAERAEAIRSRLSTLTLRFRGDTAAGEQVRVDGAALDVSQWGAALPMDGGMHVVVVTAPGRLENTSNVEVGAEGDRATLIIDTPSPVLDAPSPHTSTAIPVGQGQAAIPTNKLESGGRATAPWLWLGWTVAGAGSLGLATGVAFGVVALEHKNVARCTGNVCDPGPLADAKSAAVASDIAFAVGGVAAATGIAVLLFGPTARPASNRVGSTLMIVPSVSGGVLAWRGTW